MNIRGLGCTHEGRPNQSCRREHGNKKLDLLSVLRWVHTLAVVCHVGKTTSLTYACCQTIATCCRRICLWLQCEPSPDIIYIDKWEPGMYSSMFSRTFFSGKVCIIHYRPCQCNPWKIFCIACADAKIQHSGRREGSWILEELSGKKDRAGYRAVKLSFEVQGQSKRSSEPEGWEASALSSAGSFQILAMWMLTMHCVTHI